MNAFRFGVGAGFKEVLRRESLHGKVTTRQMTEEERQWMEQFKPIPSPKVIELKRGKGGEPM